jgi:hypothetical protein
MSIYDPLMIKRASKTFMNMKVLFESQKNVFYSKNTVELRALNRDTESGLKNKIRIEKLSRFKTLDEYIYQLSSFMSSSLIFRTYKK